MFLLVFTKVKAILDATETVVLNSEWRDTEYDLTGASTGASTD